MAFELSAIIMTFLRRCVIAVMNARELTSIVAVDGEEQVRSREKRRCGEGRIQAADRFVLQTAMLSIHYAYNTST